jgi:hypothetical protein
VLLVLCKTGLKLQRKQQFNIIYLLPLPDGLKLRQ